jgi:hypothetical protein
MFVEDFKHVYIQFRLVHYMFVPLPYSRAVSDMQQTQISRAGYAADRSTDVLYRTQQTSSMELVGKEQKK